MLSPKQGSKKQTTHFICEECQGVSRKWMGQCQECGAWDTLKERTEQPVLRDRRIANPGMKPVPITEATANDAIRKKTEIEEFDRVLGGGIVAGSVILVGGDPGIGKSTMLLHVMSKLTRGGEKVLYVSGEESATQIRLRANRLGTLDENIFVATATIAQSIVAMADEMKPSLVAIDSIQTMVSTEVSGVQGSVAQVRESTALLIDYAKTRNIPVIIVGHVTKDGAIAGPKILEHMVDTVLYFEGDKSYSYRLLRTVKNRFGPTNEIGVFEMREEGLIEVKNPSELFLSERPIGEPGSAVVASIEGTRPILIEVQALVSPTNLGMARRTAIGADPKRLGLLCAVLEKKAGMDLYGNDIYLNIAGGLRVDEPALDLGVVTAIISSLLEKFVPATTVVYGEVGLAGEIRGAGQARMRIREAERLGFKKCIIPAGDLKREKYKGNINVVGVNSVHELLQYIFEE